jgi:hypothetical protein
MSHSMFGKMVEHVFWGEFLQLFLSIESHYITFDQSQQHTKQQIQNAPIKQERCSVKSHHMCLCFNRHESVCSLKWVCALTQQTDIPRVSVVKSSLLYPKSKMKMFDLSKPTGNSTYTQVVTLETATLWSHGICVFCLDVWSNSKLPYATLRDWFL